MKRFRCSAVCRPALVPAIIAALALAWMSTSAQAQDSVLGAQTSGERIHITSDRLIADTEGNTAEFIGNVRATQGETVIVGDRMKIFYHRGEDGETDPTGQTSIRKIVVNGKVTIQIDDRVAETEHAEYVAQSGILVLTGANSKITSQDNSVSGDKITLYRLQNRMEVEGSGSKRVEAVLYPKEEGQK